jgi:hypothetical protein
MTMTTTFVCWRLYIFKTLEIYTNKTYFPAGGGHLTHTNFFAFKLTPANNKLNMENLNKKQVWYWEI